MNTKKGMKSDQTEKNISGSRSFKSCPKCRKSNHLDARICTCGFWLKTDDFLQVSLPQIRKERFRKKIRKAIGLAAFAMFAWLAIYWGGFAEIASPFENSDEKATFAARTAPPGTDDNASHSAVSRGIIEGRVVAVKDGETITLAAADNEKYEIRLGGIDAPDLSEQFGQQARENLSNFILDKNVRVYLQKIEADGRLVGKVLSDGKNINLEQIRNGAAKHNVFDADEQPRADREFYAATETEAKTAGTGLWAGIGYAPEATVPDKSTAAEPAPAVSVKSEKVVERTSPDISPETAEKEKKAEKERVNARAKESETKSEQPLKAGNKSVAAGATARCLDGTYSFRKTRSGSCAYHGGVAEWLNEAKVPKKKAAASSNTQKYILGPRGGCYFINASGNRTYVDRSLCK